MHLSIYPSIHPNPLTPHPLSHHLHLGLFPLPSPPSLFPFPSSLLPSLLLHLTPSLTSPCLLLLLPSPPCIKIASSAPRAAAQHLPDLHRSLLSLHISSLVPLCSNPTLASPVPPPFFFHFLSPPYPSKLSSYASPLDLLISICSRSLSPWLLSLPSSLPCLPHPSFFLTLFFPPLPASAPAASAV